MRTLIIILILIGLSSCVYDPPPKLIRHNLISTEIVEEIRFLEDSAVIKFNLDYPPKYFNKKQIYHFKPKVIIDDDTIELEVINIYGESFENNSNIVSFRYGNEFHLEEKIKIDTNFSKMIIVGGGDSEWKNKNAIFNKPMIFKVVKK